MFLQKEKRKRNVGNKLIFVDILKASNEDPDRIRIRIRNSVDGSADPDLYQNVTHPQHWLVFYILYSYILFAHIFSLTLSGKKQHVFLSAEIKWRHSRCKRKVPRNYLYKKVNFQPSNKAQLKLHYNARASKIKRRARMIAFRAYHVRGQHSHPRGIKGNNVVVPARKV